MEAPINKKNKFKIGDLVEFDCAHKLGIVIDVKMSTAFVPPEEVQDIIEAEAKSSAESEYEDETPPRTRREIRIDLIMKKKLQKL